MRTDCLRRLPALVMGVAAGAASAQVDFFAVAPEAPLLVPGANQNVGDADPYPSRIEVVGVQSPIERVEVVLTGFTHTYPADVTLVLVGPTGDAVVLMSGCGGSNDVNETDIFFVDDAPNPLPSTGTIQPGAARPTVCAPVPALRAPAPPGPYFDSLAVFHGEDANGVWELYAFDNFTGDEGIIPTWQVRIYEQDTNVQHFYGSTIDVPVLQPEITAGPGFPYPSVLYVTGVEGMVIRSMTVRLRHIAHSWPSDLEVLLVGPTTHATMLLSDTGGGTAVTNTTLAFTSEATLPAPSPLTPGSYAPTDNGPGETWDPPAPIGQWGTDMGPFLGTDPTGPWMLFVQDDEEPDSGQILFWDISLYLEPAPGTCLPELTGDTPPNLTILDLLTYLEAWYAGCP